MADESPEQRRLQSRPAGSIWRFLPVVLVNQAVGQVNDGEIVLTFGRVLPPPLLGAAEDKPAQIEAIGVLPIVPAVRMTMTIGRLRAVVETLKETIAIYERQASALEEVRDEAPEPGGEATS